MKGLHVCSCVAIACSLIGGTANAESRKCPALFPDLANDLTQDLPDYLNRTYTRLGIKRQAIAVSFPDINPLPFSSLRNFVGGINDVKKISAPEQIFISVLTKNTNLSKNTVLSKPQTQPYWLFIAKTNRGWRLAMTFTRVNSSSIIDVSEGAIAQATNIWLSDRCNLPQPIK